jgi:hypothetical protein
VPAPAPRDLVAWPEGFGTRFVLGVDTEEEFDWTRPPAAAARGLTALAALPAAQTRLAGMGAAPLYLVDHPVAADPAAADRVRAALAAGPAEVGTQLHPWVNPPFDGTTDAETFAGALPEAVEAAKLDRLTAAIEAAFGSRPIAYRAGRYGLGPATLRLLASRGYRLDSSMRARYDYTAEGGPDYARVGAHAFRCGPGGVLVELPLTAVFTGRLGERGRELYRRAPWLRGPLARARLVERVALTPEDMPLPAALEAARVALGEGVRVLNLSCHSPSLVPGHTPYVRDAADLRAFWRWWEAMLGLLARRGVRAVGAAELVTAAAGGA